jgi:hypothetical protein
VQGKDNPMALENINYAAMLADMKAKRAALDSSISALETALASGALGQPSDPSFVAENGGASGSIGPMDLPSGALLGKSVPVAIKLYLEATKRKQSPQEIATAIRELGVESTSSNFNTIVATTLKRLRISGDVLRFKDGWGLSGWAPPSLRNSLESSRTEKAAKKKRKASAKRKKDFKVAGGSVPNKPGPKPESKPAGMEAQLEAHFAAHPNQEITCQSVADALGLKIQTVNFVCGKLAYKGKLEKIATGKYRALKPQPMQKAG